MVPHRCPVCLGHGNVPGGFYNCVPGGTPTSCNTSETCRSCNGTGVIYCSDQEPDVLKSGVYPPQYGFYGCNGDEILQILKSILEELQGVRRDL